MRQIFLDTETTGLEPSLGHRIIEIAAIELINRRPTGKKFHHYLNPERSIEQGALEVHGITIEFLKDKPKFCDVVNELLEFIKDAELIMHNAPFDVAFLNHEFSLFQGPVLHQVCARVTDTLKMAKDLHPGKKNNLNALCERYQVDNSQRTLHGALLDAQILSEVYLAMTRGQESLMMELEGTPIKQEIKEWKPAERKPLVVLPALSEEESLHQLMLQEIDRESKGKLVWQ